MSWLGVKPRRLRLDVVAGLTDGILTALTLGAGRLMDASTPVSVSLAFRVAGAASISGAFVFFVAHYADLRGELIEAERQLNLMAHGRLATTRLGEAVFREAFLQAIVASVCTFVGALLPMLIGTWHALPRYTSTAASMIALSVLGILLARVTAGRPWRWAGGLAIMGLALAGVGTVLQIV